MNLHIFRSFGAVSVLAAAVAFIPAVLHAQMTYHIVDTRQNLCYNNQAANAAPQPTPAFYGQDAQYSGNQPAYLDNGDGTVTDLVTGLMWTANLPAQKYTYTEALTYAAQAQTAGYSDWRLPTIKELYSLIDFTGSTGLSAQSSVPYLDTAYFDFRYGGTIDPSERYIDAQFATTALYKGTVMNNQQAMFGVNFADGRIKGYPLTKKFEVMLVRGRTDYGVNAFTDNHDGTVTDAATGLMWDKNGSAAGMNWQNALAYAQTMNAQNYLGHSDWRLPNAKELHSIVDYNRSPSYTNSAAIDPVFAVPSVMVEGGRTDYPFYWTNTTHVDGPAADKAVYVAFGSALGFMEQPPASGNYVLMDVHGAGAQRSDPKSGDPANYPHGHGPQGDVIRIYNYVRLVRNTTVTTGYEPPQGATDFGITEVYPNPALSSGIVTYTLTENSHISLAMYSALGGKVATLAEGYMQSGLHRAVWNTATLPAGIYYVRLSANGRLSTRVAVVRR